MTQPKATTRTKDKPAAPAEPSDGARESWMTAAVFELAGIRKELRLANELLAIVAHAVIDDIRDIRDNEDSPNASAQE
jgi:hypothetical protein